MQRATVSSIEQVSLGHVILVARIGKRATYGCTIARSILRPSVSCVEEI